MDPGTPVWTQLTVALGSMRVLRELQTSGGHFTTSPISLHPRLAQYPLWLLSISSIDSTHLTFIIPYSAGTRRRHGKP